MACTQFWLPLPNILYFELKSLPPHGIGAFQVVYKAKTLSVDRQQVDTKQVFEQKSESCSDNNNVPLTKHVDPSRENVDKACLSVSRAIPMSGEILVHLAVDPAHMQPMGDGEWNDIQTTEARIADVREVALENERSSLDIPVVSLPVDTEHEHRVNSSH